MSYTMVLADDEPMVIKSEELFLQKEFPDIEVVGIAENGVQLKEMLENLKPDIAMVDIRMPGLTGLEVIEFLEHRKDIPTHFVVQTAYSDFEYIQKALNLKTDGYLLKPSKPQEKKAVIERLCQAVEEERESNRRRGQLVSAMKLVNHVLGSEVLQSIFTEKCDEEGFQSYCQINNVIFRQGCIVSFIPSVKKHLSRGMIQETLKHTLDGLCKYLVTVTGEGVVLMLMTEEGHGLQEALTESAALENWCREVAALIAEKLEAVEETSFLYGVGGIYDNFLQMKDSYHESTIDLQSEQGLENADKVDFYVVSAKQYVKTYYSRDISLTELAENVGISSYYLSHVFKEKTGKTVVEYLADIRIREAKQLSLETSLTIREIAEKVGYSNITYFCKVFKKTTGMTIGEFRKVNKQEDKINVSQK